MKITRKIPNSRENKLKFFSCKIITNKTKQKNEIHDDECSGDEKKGKKIKTRILMYKMNSIFFIERFCILSLCVFIHYCYWKFFFHFLGIMLNMKTTTVIR